MWVYFVLTVIFVVSVPATVYALTLEEIEALQAEQKQIEDELKEIKVQLEDNQQMIDSTVIMIEDIKFEIRALKQAEADDQKIFAQEILLAQEKKNLREFRLDRVEILEEQSQKKQRANSINDDVRYNVAELDESNVEFVSSENINLQINIDELKKQLMILDQVTENIDEEIFLTDEQIDQYKRTIVKYQAQYDKIQTDQRTSWDAVAKFSGAKTLVDNFNGIIQVLEDYKDELGDEKRRISQEYQTIVTVIETNTKRLLENEIDISKQKKLVGLQLSKACIMLLKNGFPTNCPSYQDLINLDSSNTAISGKFVVKDGFFQRDEPLYTNSWQWYQYDNSTRLILDPPFGMTSRIPMITIENNLGTYFIGGDFKVENFTKTYQKDRYIDRCIKATISSNSWERTLTDTINMLRTGCTETTIQTEFTDVLPKTNIDITTSPYWQYTQWLETAKKSCQSVCKQY